MKIIWALIYLVILVSTDAFVQTEFVLDPNQSMLMTGKGLGQDATINPYLGKDCYVHKKI